MSVVAKAVSESSVQIGQLTMRVYHLDDGRRIIHGDDVAAFFKAMGDGELSPDDLTQVAALLKQGAA